MLNRLLNSPAYAATVAGLVVGLLLSLFLLAKIVTEVKVWVNGDGIYPTKTITVNGEGKVVAVPDIATFNFSVVEEGKTTEEAQTKATDKINKAVALLKANGVEDKDIKTEGYNTNPKYDFARPCTAFDCPPATNTIIGYEVSQSVTVKVRQQEDAGKFLTQLGKIGVSNISGLSFTIDDESVLKDQAKEKAIEDAKAKATKLAKDLGVKLGDVISFGEDQMYGPMYGEGIGGGVMNAKADIAPVLPAGENTYTSRVWINYELK